MSTLIGVGCGPKKTNTPVGADNGDAGAAQGDAGADSGDAGAGNSGGSRNAAGADSGGSAAGGSSGATASELDEFFDEQGKGYCQRSFRCFEGNDDFSSAHLILQTLARCEALLERFNATAAPQRDLRTQMAAGHLHLVPQQAQRCLEDLASCNGPNGFDRGSCRDVFEGDVALGDACQRSSDCVGDAYCDTAKACPGSCVARKKESEPCSNDDECSYTEGVLSCYRGMSAVTGVCHTQTWAPKAAEGKPCTRRLSDAAQIVTCEDEFWCGTAPGGDPDTDVMGVCTKPIANGMPCQDGDDVCATGVCDADSDAESPSFLCQPVQVVDAEGDACNKEQLVICDPLGGLVCGKDLKCQASGDGSEGSGCFDSDYQPGCNPGLYCDRTGTSSSDELGTCKLVAVAGETCSGNSACESNLCGADKTCATRACFR